MRKEFRDKLTKRKELASVQDTEANDDGQFHVGFFCIELFVMYARKP